MTEQVPPISPDGPDGPEAGDHEHEAEESPRESSSRPVSTGVPAVDAVLGDLDGVGDLPVHEQLSAFERAHASLRTALDAPPPDDRGGEPGEPA